MLWSEVLNMVSLFLVAAVLVCSNSISCAQQAREFFLPDTCKLLLSVQSMIDQTVGLFFLFGTFIAALELRVHRIMIKLLVDSLNRIIPGRKTQCGGLGKAKNKKTE